MACPETVSIDSAMELSRLPSAQAILRNLYLSVNTLVSPGAIINAKADDGELCRKGTSLEAIMVCHSME